MTGLVLDGLSVRYGRMTAVKEASLGIPPGTTHGLVGESGSGKSSLARAIVGLAPRAGGRVTLDGRALDAPRALPVQMVFQNPYASLNPRMTIAAMLDEALALRRPGLRPSGRRAEAAALLARVGLDPALGVRYPHQFSGGQRQRIAIARALATGAPVLILDEVTSALDVSVQAAILNLLKGLQREGNLSYLFISHDLAAVRHVSDTVSVMYLGRIVETATRDRLFGRPAHPYTAGLLAAVPDPRRIGANPARLAGEIPDPQSPPTGCAFHPRCPIAAADPALMRRCATMAPPLAPVSSGGLAACHAPLQETA